MPQGEIVLSYLAPASSLLFHPRSQTVRVVANQCQPRVATVQGHKGRVVTGQIIPALQDVRVMMEVVEEGVTSLLEALSDEKGFYAFSAIEPAAEFISWVLCGESLNRSRWRRCARATCSTSPPTASTSLTRSCRRSRCVWSIPYRLPSRVTRRSTSR